MSEQSMQALSKANGVRAGGQVACQEIAAGVLTVAQALDDPRPQHLSINRVLCAQRNYGPNRAGEVLRSLHIWPTRRVRDLTAHQKAAIVVALADADERRERRAA